MTFRQHAEQCDGAAADGQRIVATIESCGIDIQPERSDGKRRPLAAIVRNVPGVV